MGTPPDGHDSVVPIEPLNKVALHKPVSAENVDSVTAHFKGPVSNISFGHQDENINKTLVWDGWPQRSFHHQYLFELPKLLLTSFLHQFADNSFFNSFLRIFPVAVMGTLSLISTIRGYL